MDVAATRGAAALLLAGGLAINAVPGDQGIPCPLRTITGVPCPFCGMTTGVTATLRGDVAGAFAANPASVALVAFAVLLLIRAVRQPRLALPTWGIVAAVAGLWVFELFRFGLL